MIKYKTSTRLITYKFITLHICDVLKLSLEYYAFVVRSNVGNEF